MLAVLNWVFHLYSNQLCVCNQKEFEEQIMSCNRFECHVLSLNHHQHAAQLAALKHKPVTVPAESCKQTENDSIK